MSPRPRLPWLVGAAVCASGCAGAADRDVVPPSRDAVGSPAPGADQTGGYAYVARRPVVVVALAEARGIDPDIARMAVDHLADRVQTCVSDELRRGSSASGAARVVAQVDPAGTVAGATLRVDPGGGGAATAALCLLAPTRLLTFPPSDRPDRGFALEALWGPRPPQ